MEALKRKQRQGCDAGFSVIKQCLWSYWCKIWFECYCKFLLHSSIAI